MNSISQNCTDEELNSAMAIYVNGWKEKDSSFEECQWEMADGERTACPPYATSVDEILPLLESWANNQTGYVHANNLIDARRVWLVWLVKDPFTRYEAEASTFARAACFALLKAHGVRIVS